MISIRTMVRVGPWMLTHVEMLTPSEERVPCERCSRLLREIWCLEVAASEDRLALIEGRSCWRIGNRCGPTLLDQSDVQWFKGRPAVDPASKSAATWRAGVDEVTKRVGLLKRVRRVLDKASADDLGERIASELREGLQRLSAGPLGFTEKKRLGFVASQIERQLGLRK